MNYSSIKYAAKIFVPLVAIQTHKSKLHRYFGICNITTKTAKERRKMAAGIRTAPNVTTPTSHRRVSFSLIDSSGTIRTDSYYVPATTTLAQIEAYAEALQAVSGASMYKIEITDVFEGAQSRSNAQSQSHDSVFKNIVIGTNIPSKINESISVYIPAPDPVNFWDNTDRWKPDKMAPAAFIKAALLMLGGAERVPTGYRFTQRRKSGRRTKI